MDSVAQALADPLRREVLRRLREGAAPAGVLAEEMGARFRVSRPAVSRHLRVLREAGLVRDVPQGRERVYHLHTPALDALEAFLAELRTPSVWDRRLAALDTEVHRQKRRRGGAAGVEAAPATAVPPSQESA